MIRKLKNILNKDNGSDTSASESNFSSSEAASSLHHHQLATTTIDHVHSSPVNFIKARQLRSYLRYSRNPELATCEFEAAPSTPTRAL